MQMQEPDQQRRFGQVSQASQAHSDYSAEYTEGFEPEYFEVVTEDNYQQQKIHPQEGQSSRGKVHSILAIVLSSIGFFISVAGIVVSAIVLRYANGQQVWLVGGVIGLVSSILVMVVCIAIFVTTVLVLTFRLRRMRRRSGAWV
ncbi:MAG TPA: hypothetical protein VFN02_06925 [Ktedonobacteraceae bacterium]|nr:hypothetical protein [Ktedonobacteraceae bacterium]